MATGSSLTQNHTRSQSEIQGDFHKVIFVIALVFHIKMQKFWASFGVNSACTILSLSKDFGSTPFTADGAIPDFIQIGKVECCYPRELCFVSVITAAKWSCSRPELFFLSHGFSPDRVDHVRMLSRRLEVEVWRVGGNSCVASLFLVVV
ncbi:hypothetical protein TNCV_3810211 [Trichonephila clavipes]|nr:hypothetical protein TNCV_3810211 [Trichonephila clavipes]